MTLEDLFNKQLVYPFYRPVATYNRLRSLADEGRLKSKQIGGRNTVWWLAESEKPQPRSFFEE